MLTKYEYLFTTRAMKRDPQLVFLIGICNAPYLRRADQSRREPVGRDCGAAHEMIVIQIVERKSL